MRASLLLLLASLCAACGTEQGNPLAPIGDAHKVSQTPVSPTKPAAPAPTGIVVTGPRGCVEASTLPNPVVWTITHIPAGATFAKAYHFDDRINCDSTEQNQRTQNDHLRIIPIGPDSVRVEFDLNENLCTGRQQPDVSVNGAVAIGMIIKRSDGKVCKPPTPLPTPAPRPSPPSEPPTPGPPAPPEPVPPGPPAPPVPPPPGPPAPQPPAPPDDAPPRPVPPPEPKPDCPQREHHCEKTKHRDCRRDACQRDRCHEQKGRAR